MTLITLVLSAGCARTAAVPTYEVEPLVITGVVAAPEDVLPGQRALDISVAVENRTASPLGDLLVELRMSMGEIDLTAEYPVTADPSNPGVLAGAAPATLRFRVDVHPNATPGLVLIGAEAHAYTEDAQRVDASAAAPEATDTWRVGTVIAITVSTVDDEDDIGAGTPTVAAAGGAVDLSLREAIEIANAAGEPIAIRFDPAVFPADSTGLIRPTAALGALPPITNPGTVIDGSDAGVVIDGGNLIDLDGLTLAADDIIIRGIAVHSFTGGAYPACIRGIDVNRVQIQDCILRDCGDAPDDRGDLIRLVGANNAVLDNQLLDALGDGIDLGGTNAIIRGNEIRGGPDDGIQLSGDGHSIEDNMIAAHGDHGIQMSGTGVVIRGNDIESHSEAGIEINGASQRITIENNELSDNWLAVILESSTVTRVTLRGNVYSTWNLIEIVSGANEGIEPPVLTSFDGTQIDGTSTAADGSIVEVYRMGWRHAPLGVTTVTAGKWSFTLPVAEGRVGAIVTNPTGSTSAFSNTETFEFTLSVTTALDELDGGSEITTVAEAGGAGDISLREAILISNARLGADLITFDAGTFPAAIEVTIAIDPSLGVLPLITDSKTVIDAMANDVVIDGGSSIYPSDTDLLSIRGDDVEIRGLTIRNFNSQSGACIAVRDANGVQILDSTLVNCGSPARGYGIAVQDTAWGTVIARNRISQTFHALWLNGYVDNTLIEQNDLGPTDDDVIWYNDSDIATIRDNYIHDGGDNGIVVWTTSDDFLLLGNRIVRCAGSGVHIHYSAENIELAFNTLYGNGRAVLLETDVGPVTLRNNIMARSTNAAISAAAADPMTEQYNLFFDNAGDGTSGTSAWNNGSADATSILGNPAFVDPADSDFTPTAAGIDQGIDLGYDRNGTAPGLFNGAAPDIGAVETP